MADNTAPSPEELLEENRTLKSELSKRDNKAGYAERKLAELEAKQAEQERKAFEDATKAGDFEKAKISYDAQIATLTKELETHKQSAEDIERLKKIEEQHNNYIAKEQARLLALLPEERHEECKGLPVETLQLLVSMIPEPHVGTTKHPGRTGGITDKAWKDMTTQEITDYTLSHTQSEISAKMAEGYRKW